MSGMEAPASCNNRHSWPWVAAQGRDDVAACCSIRFSKNSAVIASEAKQSFSPRNGRMDCFVASAPRNDGDLTRLHSRCARRPSCTSDLSLSRQRVQGRPGASSHPRPVCIGRKHTVVSTGGAGSSGPPCAMVLTAYFELPGDRALLPPSFADRSATLTPASGRLSVLDRKLAGTLRPLAVLLSAARRHRRLSRLPKNLRPAKNHLFENKMLLGESTSMRATLTEGFSWNGIQNRMAPRAS